MGYKNKILTLITLAGLTLSTGCFGGSGSSDGSNSLFNTGTGEDVNLSGSYTTTDLSSAVKGIIGDFSRITLTQSGNVIEGVDNLGNTYTGNVSVTENPDASGSTLNISATASNGVVINLVAAYDPEEIDYVAGTASTETEMIRQELSPGNYEWYRQVTTITTSAQTTAYKTWIGQLVLSNGGSSALTLRGDIVVTGGDKTSNVTLTKAD